MMRQWQLAIVLLSGVTVAAPVQADEVSDEINQALTAYQHQDSRVALEALDAAAHKLRQARAQRLEALLPVPPPGWRADPPETSAVSAAMLGGGTSASRTYHEGDQKVEVQLTTDSPMLKGMAELMNNPALASSDVKAVTVSGRRMAYTQRDNGYMGLIGNQVILKVDGSPQTSEATLRSFLAAVDFSAIEQLSK